MAKIVVKCFIGGKTTGQFERILAAMQSVSCRFHYIDFTIPGLAFDHISVMIDYHEKSLDQRYCENRGGGFFVEFVDWLCAVSAEECSRQNG